ncbi:centromere-associated protein E-like [Coccinella septempunctata]|uniref:centromere-associated protein E-like n=1 Tax=Coccinella septempunctata TaxID=41139 RepID=UPI001D08C904|nr:centromere-associated protein E-like [Coccinella septempunctata]
MIAKCKDISSKINELENRVNSISKPKLPTSGKNPKRPSTAPIDSNQTNSRVKLAHDMISQMQQQINGDKIAGCSSADDIHARNFDNSQIATDKLISFPDNVNLSSEIPDGSPPLGKENYVEDFIYSSSEGYPGSPRCVKVDAEKESDAADIKVKKPHSIISLKDPPKTDEKPFCECMMNNPFNNKITKIGEITVMGMVQNFPAKWPTVNTIEKPLNDAEKTMDNFLIDSLRGEIEKVRHRLCEIGKRPCDNPKHDSGIESTDITDAPSGDHENRSQLVKEVRDLQIRNAELSEQLNNYRSLQENSMNKAKDTAYLLSAYEDKVNALHEQALRSSKIMAQSKEKFCSILRSRNSQIKNLFHINQQLKKTLVINQEQMNQLSFNYKLLKSTYRELERSDKKNKEENKKYKDTMSKLEEELKFVYKECSLLKEENVRFLKELCCAKDDINRRYSSRLDKHENHCQSLILKTVESEAKLIQEVNDISLHLHSQENDLVSLRSEVKNETLELELKYKKLSYQYEALVRKFREYEQFDEIKCSCIEQELREFSLKMKEKESIILRERDELRSLVEELAKAIKRNKTAINELNSTNEQHENVIDNLNEIIKMKDEKLLSYQKELDLIRSQYEESQKEIDALKKVLNVIEEKSLPEHEELEKELQDLRELLNQEKENNLIKQKIIQDHEDTISSLKEQINEKSMEVANKVESLCRMRDDVDRLTEELKYKELDLEKEKQEKLIIMGELESINAYKETLVEQISDLENAVKSRCRNEEINGMDQKTTINKLEKQIIEQKEEWDLQKKNLQKDKEKALHAAKFASQKLLDTVSDFQKQMCQQKTAQTKLSLLLQEKEQQLETLTMKVRSLVPLQNGNDSGMLSNTSHQQNICTSFCQIKQIYPRPEQIYQSKESIEEEESRTFLDESNSYSACCDYSDT